MDSESQEIEASKKDPARFEPLYLRYYEAILRFVYKRVESLEESREISAIVFTKALSNIGKYRHMGFPFSSWLYRIAINEINLYYRHNKKARAISIDEKAIKSLAEESGQEHAELIAALDQALKQLSEQELYLLELRYFEDRAFAEIADIMEVSENNAKVRTYRIIDKLRKIYATQV